MENDDIRTITAEWLHNNWPTIDAQVGEAFVDFTVALAGHVAEHQCKLFNAKLDALCESHYRHAKAAAMRELLEREPSAS